MKAKLILLKKTDGRANFMIRLSEHGKKAYRAAQVPFTEKDWQYDPKKRLNRLRNVRPGDTPQYRELIKNQDFIKVEEAKYNDQINDLIRLGNPFSFGKVFQLVNVENQDTPSTVFGLFRARIQDLKDENRFGTADAYQYTFNKVKSLHPTDLLFNELDDTMLLSFKIKMLDNVAPATVAIHLRTIRALYRYAIKRKVANLKDYPFMNDDIMKDLKTGYRSKAITHDEVNKLRALKKELNEGEPMWHACNYFIFGYVGRGINFQDMARLKWSDISQGRITFIRYKTRSKVQDLTNFTITEELSEILKYYRTHNPQIGNPYIFPILNGSHTTEVMKYNRIKKVRSQVNKVLKLVSDAINSEIKITTYTWRHSFAAIAKNDLKVEVSMISEMLGHKDLETTKHYLKQFPDADKDMAVSGL